MAISLTNGMSQPRNLLIALIIFTYLRRAFTFVIPCSSVGNAIRWPSAQQHAVGSLSSSNNHERPTSCAAALFRQRPICFGSDVISIDFGRRYSHIQSTSGEGIDREQIVSPPAAPLESTPVGTESKVEENGGGSDLMGDSGAVVGTRSAADLTKGVSYEAPKPIIEEVEENEESKKVRSPKLFFFDAVEVSCMIIFFK